MKPIQLVYTPAASQYLRHLHPTLKLPLRAAIEELILTPLLGKPLQNELEGFRSHRFKRYRVIYRYLETKRQIEIVYAGPRIAVYDLFAKFLKKSTSE